MRMRGVLNKDDHILSIYYFISISGQSSDPLAIKG
jgi:hypothetical protein